MKFKEKFSQILIKHRRPLLVSLGSVLFLALALALFLRLKKPVPIPPYIATYTLETQTTFGNIKHSQTEKIVVSHLDNLYKSSRFVRDIALLESTYNTPDGFTLCLHNENIDCKRLGDALTKSVGRPPRIKGLKKSSRTAKMVNIEGNDRPCHETTYSLPTAIDKNALIQNLTATVCLDDQLQIPLTASFTAHYRISDITKLEDFTIEQSRTVINLDTAPVLSASDFTAPEAK